MCSAKARYGICADLASKGVLKGRQAGVFLCVPGGGGGFGWRRRKGALQLQALLSVLLSVPRSLFFLPRFLLLPLIGHIPFFITVFAFPVVDTCTRPPAS
ncbi:hypothetical protein PLESTM_001259900 [Pleodorina starrii]|nr:hypothetical protein PLESTM_001259900 [Pleodorina starrii]